MEERRHCGGHDTYSGHSIWRLIRIPACSRTSMATSFSRPTTAPPGRNYGSPTAPFLAPFPFEISGLAGRLGISGLANISGVLYFSASGGNTGYELWKSDGTEAGTVLVQDIAPGFYSSSPQFLTNVSESAVLSSS